jgi:hypothetical protein
MGVVAAIGGVVSGAAQLAGGLSKRKAYREQAREIERTGAQQEQEFRQQGEEFKGEQRAALGAAGAEMGSGSPLQLMQDTARQVEEDAMKIRRETAYSAKQARRAGGAALAEGIAGMGSTLLTSLGGFKFKKGSKSISTASRYIPGAGWVQ